MKNMLYCCIKVLHKYSASLCQVPHTVYTTSVSDGAVDQLGPSTARHCPAHLTAVSMAAWASSLRRMPMRVLLHCCISCFFSSWTVCAGEQGHDADAEGLSSRLVWTQKEHFLIPIWESSNMSLEAILLHLWTFQVISLSQFVGYTTPALDP